MDNVSIFVLGAVSAVVVGVLIVLVVMVLRLNKKVTEIGSYVNNIFRDFPDSDRESLEEAKKYVDSRIDKVLSKVQ